jgi:hypothetical protein
MRKITYLLASLAIVLSPAIVLADNQSEDNSNRGDNVATGTERIKIENRNGEIKTTSSESENKNEDETSSTERNASSTEEEDNSSSTEDKSSSRSEEALQHMSEVAKKVQELLTTVGAKGGIGQQVSEVAKEQNDEQQATRDSIDKIDSRSGLLKALIGPNFKELGNIRAQIARTDDRIQKLNQLKDQFAGDAATQKLIGDTVTALQTQLASLENKVQTEESSPSLFGWLIRLFNR